MISCLDKIISLRNFSRHKPAGQIATLLMLLMVVVLVFILVTINLGKVAVTTTDLANAADAATLYLASQLASHSRMLWENLGETTQRCKKSGFLAGLLGILGAIIAIVAAPFTAGTSLGAFFASAAAHSLATIGYGILGGAIGGAAGGGIAGTGVLKGAIQGAALGAAIGGAITTLGSLGVGAGGTTSTVGIAGPSGATVAGPGVEAAVGMNVGLEPTLISAGSLVPATSYVYGGSVLTGSVLGGVGGIGLTAGASAYNSYVADEMTANAFSKAARELSGLPEYDRIRESVIFQALVQTVDEPKTVEDSGDLDGDGNTKEKIPAFLSWWHGQIAQMHEYLTAPLRRLVAAFMKTLTGFNNALISSLARSEVKGEDGAIVVLARGLEDPSRDIFFWNGKGEVATDNVDCLTCGQDESNLAAEVDLDSYHDEIRAVELELGRFVQAVEELKSKKTSELAATWESWIGLFYDEENKDNDDYYVMLDKLVEGDTESDFKGLKAWRKRFYEIRGSLPKCHCHKNVYVDENPRDGQWDDRNGDGVLDARDKVERDVAGYCNAPCKFEMERDGEVVWGLTVDENSSDEYWPAIDAIDGIIAAIKSFPKNAKDFYESMQAAQEKADAERNKPEKMTHQYSWKDSLGSHSVAVTVGPFRMARIESKKSGNFLKRKICLNLVDFCDNMKGCLYNHGGTWVRITRQDPTNRQIKEMKKGAWLYWNPNVSGTIRRGSSAYYSFDAVGLRDN